MDAAIDGNFFKECLNREPSKRAAQRATFGAYCATAIEEGLGYWFYVKGKGALNYNTGARSIVVMGGVG